MKQVAKFEKVSFKQFKEDALSAIPNITDSDELKKIYESITLPKRATKDSAGYDFITPFDITLSSGQTVKIPTGIRCKMDTGWVLKCYPRSGLGFKYRLQLDNSVGIIDGDYYNSDNEGHIFVKLTNDSKEHKRLELKAGDKFVQGIFTEYGLTYDDETTGTRNGGMGSTDRMSINEFISKLGLPDCGVSNDCDNNLFCEVRGE